MDSLLRFVGIGSAALFTSLPRRCLAHPRERRFFVGQEGGEGPRVPRSLPCAERHSPGVSSSAPRVNPGHGSSEHRSAWTPSDLRSRTLQTRGAPRCRVAGRDRRGMPAAAARAGATSVLKSHASPRHARHLLAVTGGNDWVVRTDSGRSIVPEPRQRKRRGGRRIACRKRPSPGRRAARSWRAGRWPMAPTTAAATTATRCARGSAAPPAPPTPTESAESPSRAPGRSR
jgi:hypothetical protein